MKSGEPAGPTSFPDEAELARRAGDLLDEIAAHPRFAGSESEKKARGVCRAAFEADGFLVNESEFVFSQFPGRYGAPLVAGVLLVTALLTLRVYLRYGGDAAAFATLLLGLMVSGLIGSWLTGRGRFVGGPTWSTNLIASRGQPRIWLVAHLDSKSQTLPMVARIASIALIVAAFALLGISISLEWLAPLGTPTPGGASFVPIVALIAAAATLPMIFCLIGNASPGAVDNASGVIAVILAASLLREREDLGVILTSGEELGLAGARAHAQSISYFSASSSGVIVPCGANEKIPFAGAVALNCDTVDDAGQFLCMTPRGDRGAGTMALIRAAGRTGVSLSVRSVLPGVLVDSIAFADAGWDSLTLSRGNIATLARVHTSGDTRERLNGTGIAKAAYLLAATVQELE